MQSHKQERPIPEQVSFKGSSGRSRLPAYRALRYLVLRYWTVRGCFRHRLVEEREPVSISGGAVATPVRCDSLNPMPHSTLLV